MRDAGDLQGGMRKRLLVHRAVSGPGFLLVSHKLIGEGRRAACRPGNPGLQMTFCDPRQECTAIKQHPLCRSPSGRVLGQSRFRTGKARPRCGHRRLGNEGLGWAGHVPDHTRPQGAKPTTGFLAGSRSILQPDGQGQGRI